MKAKELVDLLNDTINHRSFGVRPIHAELIDENTIEIKSIGYDTEYKGFLYPNKALAVVADEEWHYRDNLENEKIVLSIQRFFKRLNWNDMEIKYGLR